MGRVAVAEVLDLPFKVFFLMRGADSGVDDLFLLGWLFVIVTKELENVVTEVDSFSSRESFA